MALLGAASEAAAGDHALSAVQSHSISIPAGALAITLHVAAMLAVMGVVSVVVYDRVGLAVLRRAWINLDAIWAGAFVLAGLVTFFT